VRKCVALIKKKKKTQFRRICFAKLHFCKTPRKSFYSDRPSLSKMKMYCNIARGVINIWKIINNQSDYNLIGSKTFSVITHSMKSINFLNLTNKHLSSWKIKFYPFFVITFWREHFKRRLITSDFITITIITNCIITKSSFLLFACSTMYDVRGC